MVARRFPVDPFTARAHRRRRRIRRAAFGAAVVVVVAAGAGVTAAAISRRPDAGFRTASVTTQDLESSLAAVATIEPVNQAAVAFPVAGTVATVDVAPGAQVAVGQPLATLDGTQLQAQLHTAQQALDQAQLILAKALAGEDVSSLLRAGGGGGSMRTVSLLPTIVEPTFVLVSAVGAAQIAAAQQAVLAAQAAVDAARSAAAAKLDSATTVCAAVGAAVNPSAGATSTIKACQAALQDVVTAQGAVSTAQANLVAAASKLDDLLTQYAKQLQSTPTTTSPPPTTAPPTTRPPKTGPPTTTTPGATGTTTPSVTPTGPGGGGRGGAGRGGAGGSGSTAGAGGSGSTAGGRSGSGGRPSGASGASGAAGSSGASRSSGSSGASRSGGSPTLSAGGGSGTGKVASPSSADLISYQAAVDSATAGVTAAQQAVEQATVVSPIAGTVVGVGVAVGQQVTAGSSTQRIIVQGAGGYEATASLDLTDVVKVKVGQPATLLPDGGTLTVAGDVVGVSALPDSASSATTTTYRVTVGLDGDTSSLRNGALGALSIVTASAKGVLAVPSSAVTMVGARHVVQVLTGTTTTETPVTVGVVGGTWTEITRGLSAGQQVVVADLGAALPSSATTASQTTARQFARTIGGGGAGGGGPGVFVRPGG